MTGPIAAIVLAAGEGSRFGLPKALAHDDGKTFLQIAIERLLDAGLDRIAVVLGARAEAIRTDHALISTVEACAARGVHLSFSENREWKEGRTGSIAVGLHGLGEDTAGALIHQVDFPHVRASTFRSLVRAFELTPGPEGRIFLPVHEGRRGHPIVIGRSIWAAISAMGKDEPLRDMIRREAHRVTEVPIDDPGTLRNVNTPGDAADDEKPHDRGLRRRVKP